MATISTHNGPDAHREHNIRNKKVIAKQPHVIPGGEYEIWKDETLTHAYHRIFNKAINDYNAKQKRSDRKIKNYLANVKKDAKKNPCYEMIIGVYKGGDKDTNKRIMRDFVDGWSKRNPNLELIGAYYHADEDGDPHVHIDYIPVAHGYKKGMETQNGYVKALNEMGFYTRSANDTAQMQWQRAENRALEEICNFYGVEVEHPKLGVEHLHTEIYKAKKEAEKVEELKQTNEALESSVNEKKNNLEEIDSIIVDKTGEVNILEQNLCELEGQVMEAKNMINALQIDVEEKQDAKRLLTMIEKAYKDVKKRHPYTIEVIEEHDARHNPITKKETRPATVEISKEDYDTLIKDINFIQMLRELLQKLIDMFKEIVGQLKEKVVQQEEYKNLNRKYVSIKEELSEVESEYEQLMADNEVLEAEVTKEKEVLEYLYSKLPKASILARIRIYEYNFKNKNIYGYKSGGTWLIKNPDGKEVEIWQYLKDYAKECVENDAEIDGFMSGAYYEYYGIPLEYYAEKFNQNIHSQVMEREYSL